ncbi:MAG TPA: polysaccharide biosynthesis tyrosine autokinase [Chitinophagaceae bacterium]|nr:polysaccharide biosynthesis tyrosine autokinase [Chitinophagaceae bacterium]
MGENSIKTVKKESNILSSFFFRFIPYWPLFLSLLAIFIIAAWVYLRYQTPIYAASATIVVKDEKRGVDESKIMESLNAYATSKIVENEIEVIRSRTLANEVVDSLRLYAPIYEDSRVRPGSAYTTSPIVIEAKNPEHLPIVSKINFSYDSSTNKVSFDNQYYLLNQWVTTPYGILKFTKNSHKTNDAQKPLYFSLYPSKLMADIFLGNLGVSAVSKLSTVIYLSLKDEDPTRAEDFLNELADAYNRAAISNKNKLAFNTLAFLDDRIKLVQRGLDSIEKKVQQYRSQKGVIDLGTQGRLFLENVGDNDRKVADISMQLAALDQVEKYVVGKDNKAGIVPSTLGVNDPVLSQLLQKLSESEVQYQSLKQTTAENNTVLTSLKSEIDQIRPLILENIRNQRQGMLASRGNLSATNNRFSSELQTLPQKERELLEISRQQAIKANTFQFLLQKREETALSYASAVSDSRIVDRARASWVPISPKKSLIYLIAIGIALGLGIALVCGKELLSTRILFRSDIENFTKVPIAAEIASVQHKHELVVNQPKNTFIAEQFRHMRAAIGLYGKTVLKKKLLVTSSIAGEGKSFVASNLALSLAISGKKVVLIDADLRSPKTSFIFKLQNEKGMAEFLEGKSDVDEIIKEGGNKNLYVIPAGHASINPTELLLTGNLKELFDYLEGVFDYILIDTSPVDPVTDAYILSGYCDKTLFVIRHGYTPKTMIQLLDENNKVKALRSLSIVFNGVKKRGFLKGGYGYGYGYGYEYVYKERLEIGR